MSQLKILVVDDDQGLRMSVRSALQATQRFYVEEAFDGIHAIEKIRSQEFDIALLDVDMPRLNGLETLRLIKEHNPGIVVIIMTAFANIDDAVSAVKDGAYNYLQKPVSNPDMIQLIDKAVVAHTLISNAAVSAPILVEAGRKFIGANSQMQKVFNIILKLSKVDTPVLIRGASGTGKELVARAIHFNSTRKEGKFVAINCSAIPENLFESELFGHEKGSFTGAFERKIGKFQFAEGGTLFLDEVGDLPLLMQVKLLRVLQEKLFTPVGSNREIQSNVRIIAATNRPLEEMMKSGSFREDLFYRLNVIPIFLPSLTERKDDLESLIAIFIRKFNESHSKKINGMASDALSVFKKYDWPGNIRELENIIEHCFIMENSNQITLASLPEVILHATNTVLPQVPIQGNGHSTSSMKPHHPDSHKELLRSSALHSSNDSSSENEEFSGNKEEDSAEEDLDLIVDPSEEGPTPALSQEEAGALDFNAQKEVFEKEFIIKALKTFRGRINQTALHANIPKKTLLRKIEKYGINAKDFVD